MRLTSDTSSYLFFKAFFILVAIGFLGFSVSAYADIKLPDINTMVRSFSATAPGLMQFVTAFAYVMGMVLIIQGVLEAKHFGEARTSMSREHGGVKSVLLYLGTGSALLYLPSTVHVGLTTFWDVPTPYAYLVETKDPWEQLVQSIIMIIQLIGTIAVIRGLIILSHVGQSGGQQGGIGRAITHILSGFFLINIYQFIQVILNTFGVGHMM